MGTKGLTNSYESAKYSFSGSDAKAYFIVPKEESEGTNGFDAIPVESLSTVSVQTYEPVGRARALGYRSVKGFAHSVREVAGTLILTVVNDHPLRPLMSRAQSKTRYSHDKDKGFGSMAAGDDLFAAGLADGQTGSAIIQEATSIATLLGHFGLFIDYVSEYPKYDEEFISNFKLGDQISSSSGPGQLMGVYDGGFYQKTNFYEEMFSNKYLRLRDEYLKGPGKRSYGGMFDHYGDDYARMNRSGIRGEEGVIGATKFNSNGNLLVETEFADALNNSISQNPEFLKKEYRDDIEKILNRYTGHAFNYSPKVAVRQNERAGLYIEGIRIISEGIVTSVNDMVTEMTFQFIAEDLKTISRLNSFENDTMRTDELAAILANPKTAPYQMQQEMDRLKADNPELRNMKVINDTEMINGKEVLKTTIVADTGIEWTPTTKKQRRKMYKKGDS